ncbi:MAG: hypothetical protein P1R58_11200 [bacterium]|nr:hypothetical protein [bacterium]
MIWLKRVSPFVLLAAILWGYNWYDKTAAANELRQADQKALITAQVWIASAKHHNDPDQFITARDSILSSSGMNPDSMQAFLEVYREAEERYAYFVDRVKYHIDSMCIVEDSLIREEAKISKEDD